jgi:hypothetical protein
MLQEQLSRIRERHGPGRPIHQLHAKFLFHLFDGDRKTRLDDVQPSRSRGELAFFSQGNKVQKMTHFHKRSRYSSLDMISDMHIFRFTNDRPRISFET